MPDSRSDMKSRITILGGPMKQKKWFIIAAVTLMVAAASYAWAAQGDSRSNAIQMQSLIYGATIDSKAAFYQKRIYLVDSEFSILSDIGKDAVEKIAFLKAYRQKLIDNMVTKNVPLNTSSLNSFLGTRIHRIETSMQAYSTE